MRIRDYVKKIRALLQADEVQAKDSVRSADDKGNRIDNNNKDRQRRTYTPKENVQSDSIFRQRARQEKTTRSVQFVNIKEVIASMRGLSDEELKVSVDKTIELITSSSSAAYKDIMEMDDFEEFYRWFGDTIMFLLKNMALEGQSHAVMPLAMIFIMYTKLRVERGEDQDIPFLSFRPQYLDKLSEFVNSFKKDMNDAYLEEKRRRVAVLGASKPHRTVQ